MQEKPDDDLERIAHSESRPSLVKDFWFFLLQEKKWWLLPILVILLAISVLLLLSTSGIAPYIYSFF